MSNLINKSRLSNKQKALLTDAIECEVRFTLSYSLMDELFYLRFVGDTIALSKVIMHNGSELYDKHEANIENITKEFISIYSYKFGQKVTYKIPLSLIINTNA